MRSKLSKTVVFLCDIHCRIEGDINDTADMLGGSTGDMITSGLTNATIGEVTIEDPIVNVEEPTVRKNTYIVTKICTFLKF